MIMSMSMSMSMAMAMAMLITTLSLACFSIKENVIFPLKSHTFQHALPLGRPLTLMIIVILL